MARRSLQASEQGIQTLKKALKRKKWSQTYIAGAVGCSRQTIWSLLQGNPTDCDVFIEVCSQLGLSWVEIAEPDSPELEPDKYPSIDNLVQTIRARVKPFIQEKCGTMRVLDMTQPIVLGEIYTSINILERITGRRGLNLAELMQDADPENFERFCLGDLRQRRVPGLEAVTQFPKLMILGKPGAGKTTFLKHLAIQCIGGEFQPERIPVFITLKDFAEAQNHPDLLEYLAQTWRHLANSQDGVDSKLPLEEVLQQVLQAGKTLILLDGLDEVKDADHSRTLRQIRDFSQQFSKNQFVITCRIAAREYTFEQFTEVEIADFNDKQIADFSNKWFCSKKDEIKAEKFLQKLKQEAPIRELATSPLLLTLLCLVFEDSGSFPTNRAELYQNGVDVLLKKWDTKRNIERDQVYKRLSLKRKEDLLSQIAYTTFQVGNYFFKQRELEKYISCYIQNLSDASTDPEALELDSVAVLKSIEAQHGLFVERAREIYSFSHLTFHEYFTARKIALSSPNEGISLQSSPVEHETPLQQLINHMTEKRWREVILLTAGMLDNANTLLQSIKAQIDNLLKGDRKLQQFLVWLNQKSQSINTTHKPAAIRAFYFVLAFNLDLALDHDIDRALALDLALDLVLDRALALDYALDNARDLESDYALDLDRDLTSALDHALALDRALNRALVLDSGFELQSKLQELQSQLPDNSFNNTENFWPWWQKNSQSWIKQLRAVTITYCNIGHDWQFSRKQTERLQQYYDANKLLVSCLKSECYISRAVRQEIEETLLLPIALIQQRNSTERTVEQPNL
ncbi:NACHT domain-containing NTPase [Leptolyngbya sp. FACHB-541]|uniref:NACHT domain-containing protein n=1 Tax=Leptolyngbya sp. FACHB-541 TaxID=2692810 RepID=UPI001689052D|nr:NACHT domain-containing NTPase [Leptolyngbya sp. FACHB-541]MBD1997769.1 NACHT domain-containing NTPase [Leptolyngbya sp. FACHB-541]